ncbi:MAG: peptidoglycan DD-metalloendopeptidase family protein [Bacteroidales bacterium]|nr:peptidoglycan DD-metalloendopeptidase family protein [Bacteroidales bacterium]
MIKKRLPEILLLVIALLLLLFIGLRPVGENVYDIDSDLDEKMDSVQQNLLYGIVVDSLIAERHQVENRQNLSEILSQLGVDMKTIDLLAKKSVDIFDVRKIRSGNYYSVLSGKDSSRSLQYFVYEKNATDYVVYDLRDSVRIYTGKKQVERKLKQASGVIDNSLWMSMKEGGFNPFLAIRLSEIYAWVIDFYAIEKGDQYKVIYEQLYVDDEPAGLGRIKASWFKHMGEPFYAFYFVQDSTGDYFDVEANSLRRTFLKAPLRFSRISSGFSHSRLHPILRIRRPHHGVDYAAPTGTPVHAIGDGKIIKASYSGGAGNYVKIKHNGTYTTGYMHLSKYGNGIKTGKYVKQGDIIGYVGSTGLSTGPHLDFRFYRNGSPVNPLKVESPPAEPVDSNNLERYYEFIKDWRKKLDNIAIPEQMETDKTF